MKQLRDKHYNMREVKKIQRALGEKWYKPNDTTDDNFQALEQFTYKKEQILMRVNLQRNRVLKMESDRGKYIIHTAINKRIKSKRNNR